MNAPMPAGMGPSFDGAALADLETPSYLFDPRIVSADLEELRAQLGTPVVVSVKACPVLDLLVRCNQHFADGIEIASIGELNLTIGRLSVPRFVNTPAMDSALIGAALACKATLIAESPQQVELIANALRRPAMQSQMPVGIVLRINAASLLDDKMPAADHFGMDLSTLHAVLKRLADGKSGLEIIGLHVFAGSNSFARSQMEIARRLTALVEEVNQLHGVKLERVLIGAGLSAQWREEKLDFPAYRQALHALQSRLSVMHEAGRAVFSRAGTFATRVVAVKELNQESVVICDGGMAHCFLLAQTEQFIKRWRQPQLLKTAADSAPAPANAPARPYVLAGNSCNRADVIGRLQTADVPEPGDLLLFEHSGAYHSYSPTGFLNLRPVRHYIAS